MSSYSDMRYTPKSARLEKLSRWMSQALGSIVYAFPGGIKVVNRSAGGKRMWVSYMYKN